eukprot:1144378-Pelagomonas_calceolata.AAC.3
MDSITSDASDANKLVTTRRAFEHKNTSHSQVLEPCASTKRWRGLTALLRQCVPSSEIDNPKLKVESKVPEGVS